MRRFRAVMRPTSLRNKDARPEVEAQEVVQETVKPAQETLAGGNPVFDRFGHDHGVGLLSISIRDHTVVF